jgi:hypothetical protein
MTNQEIIELCEVAFAVDRSPNNAALMTRLDAGLDRCTSLDHALLQFTVTLLSGKPYLFSTDNPDGVVRFRSLAADLGATLVDFDPGTDITRMLFAPPRKQ